MNSDKPHNHEPIVYEPHFDAGRFITRILQDEKKLGSFPAIARFDLQTAKVSVNTLLVSLGVGAWLADYKVTASLIAISFIAKLAVAPIFKRDRTK